MSLPPPSRATARTVGLTALMVLVASGVHRLLPGLAPDGGAVPQLPWWALAVGFAAAEVAVVHLEIREEAHTFTLSGVPLVMGLFMAGPTGLLVARVVGPVAVLLRMVRQPVKLGFNAALWLCEASVAVAVFRLVGQGQGLQHPPSWLAALVAVTVTDLLSALAVATVIRWHSGASPSLGVSAPLLVSGMANGCLGVVAVLLATSHPLALGLLVVVIAVVFAAYRGYVALSQRYANLNLLYDFTDEVSGADDPAAVMDTILQQARAIMRAAFAEIVVLPDGDRPALRRALAQGGRTIHGQPAEGQVELLRGPIERGDGLLAGRGTFDPLARGYLAMLGLKECIVVPLLVEGTVIGWISVGDRLAEVSTFDGDDLRLFEALANHASIAIANGRLIEELREEAARREHQALHDGLTGLPNRTRFIEVCAEILRVSPSGRLTGVVVMDVDGFKEVNDTLGHDAGDELLQELGRRLVALAPASALVARLGGDEFAVLLSDQPDLVALRQVARRLRDGLSAPILVDDLMLTVEVSTGLACSPMHGTDPAVLLQRADSVMYAAKEDRSGLMVYTPEEDRASRRRLWIAGALRQAIEDRTLMVYFQPKLSVVDGSVVGAEALVRWHDPEHGFIPPDEFIPLAERTELMMPLTDLVMREAVAQCRRWHDEGFDLSVAVNVAARSVLDEGLLALAVSRLQEAGLPFDRLTLEITESGIMGDTQRAVTALHRIAATGIRLSVDDFGTGHSSLAYLQQLPVHEVKVDRSFLRHGLVARSDAAIVEGIIRLGHALELSVVAEGVEDAGTAQRLALLGCDIGQGYLWSRPVDRGSFLAWLDAQRTSGSQGSPSAEMK